MRSGVLNLGRVDGGEIDALIGALTMEEWEISVNPKDGTLDLSGLKRREFTEFFEMILAVIECGCRKNSEEVLTVISQREIALEHHGSIQDKILNYR